MKRSAVGSDGDNSPPPRSAKRVKASKACRTCRQQKTRCDPIDGPEMRCKRCTHFNIDCSFERSPPRKTAPLPPASQSLPSVPWASSPESHSRDFPPPAVGTSKSPGILGLTSSSGNAYSPSEIGRGSTAATPGMKPPSSPARSSQVGTVAEDPHAKHVAGHPWNHQNCANCSPEPLRYPVAPPSPPRTADRQLDSRLPYEMISVFQGWAAPAALRARNGEHWSGPLSFTNNLIARTPREQLRPSPSYDLVSQGVVTRAEAEVLTRIWKHRYAPWLPSEDPVNTPSSSVFLQVAQWIVAARHITSIPTLTSDGPLSARLSRVLDRCITRATVGLDTSIQALQALMILASWTSAVPADESGGVADASLQTQHTGIAVDGELFIETAFNLASKMHLEVDVEIALEHVRQVAKGQNPAPLPKDQLDRARMMFKISAMLVFLCIGKGRLSSTRVPLHYAEKIFGSPSLLATRLGGGADARLVFQCNLLEIGQQMAELTATSEAVQSLGPTMWVNRMQEDFKSLDHLQQAIQTSIALADPVEMVSFTLVHGQAQFIKLVMLARAFKAVFKSFPKLKSGIRTAIAAAVTGNTQALHPVEPTSILVPTQRDDGDRLRPLSPTSVNADLREHPDLVARVESTALEWARSAKEANETLLVIWLSLRQPYPYPPEPSNHDIEVDHVLSPMAYTPDFMICSFMFGITYSIKIHLMAMSVFQVTAAREELTRSLLVRVLHMLREASPPTTSDGDTADASHLNESKNPLKNEPTLNNGHPSLSSSPSKAHHPPDGVNPPALPSLTLAGRCADVLNSLIKLWDVRTQEFNTQGPKTNSVRAAPSPAPISGSSELIASSSSAKHLTNEDKPDWSSEKGLHTLASSLSSLKTMGAQHQSPSSSTVSQIPTPSPDVAPGQMYPDPQKASTMNTISGPMPVYDAGFQPMMSADPQLISVPQYTGEPGELFGTSFSFDLASFWDTSFLYGLGGIDPSM